MIQGVKKITKVYSAILLVLFLLPIFTQVTHVFIDHDHPVCTEVTTHIHHLEKDCFISDFQFTPFNYVPLQIIAQFEVTKYATLNSFYQERLTHYKSLPYFLRGPPLY